MRPARETWLKEPRLQKCLLAGGSTATMSRHFMGRSRQLLHINGLFTFAPEIILPRCLLPWWCLHRHRNLAIEWMAPSSDRPSRSMAACPSLSLSHRDRENQVRHECVLTCALSLPQQLSHVAFSPPPPALLHGCTLGGSRSGQAWLRFG